MDMEERNQVFDSVPFRLDKEALKLRERQPDKEVNPSFRMRSSSTIDRLNSMYVDDWKVLDVEVFSPSRKKLMTLG